MISNILNKNGILKNLIDSVNNADAVSVFGCGENEKLTIINELDGPILIVANNVEQGEFFATNLSNMKYRVLSLFEEYDIFSTELNNENYINILNIIDSIQNKQVDVLIITPNILNLKLPNINGKSINIRLIKNQVIDLSELINQLIRFDYEKSLDLNIGSFNVRGDIVDLFPINSPNPIRIYLDFDKIESIKEIDSVTNLPLNELDSINILSKKFIDIDFYDVKNYFVSHNETCADNYLNNYNKTNLGIFIPFDKNFNFTIFDYFTSSLVIFLDAKMCYDAFTKCVEGYNLKLKTMIEDKVLANISKNQYLSQDLKYGNLSLLAFQSINNANRFFKPSKVYNINTVNQGDYCYNLKLLAFDVNFFNKNNFTTLIFCKSNEGCNKIISELTKNKINFNVCQSISLIQYNNVNLIPKEMLCGGVFVDEKLAIIPSNKVIGEKRTIKKIDENQFDYGQLPEDNDVVVHNNYGVGICRGIKCLKLSNSLRDYIVIEYKNNDKLYLPVENIDQISKYVGSDKMPPLNKLGGVDFAKTKEKVKAQVRKMAQEMLLVYKKRLEIQGVKYSPDDILQLKFENSFGYKETADQLKATLDIKKDMESGKVMDRLICGDVGFGKTEVALRCAFKTISNGKQVAFLCPTTILSEQHFNTASVRMASFGVNVEVINRFKSAKKVQQIMKDVVEGKVDLLCGTHKILNKNLHFKNLGLLILDEEQKFGVEDKDKIKKLKENVNVLTLSATPIPRTLNMSLSGIRDISVIETPPLSRIPTHVEVVEYNDMLIKNVIEREIQRNGQVLIVFNRVEQIYSFANKIKALIGNNIVVDVAHGQMETNNYEDAIFRLYTKQTQVLIATTIIENGIDLPNANTLIVINADMLGLSQLYQLKGRIGRSDKQAFAYFTFDKKKTLSENSYKRLTAIQQFTSLGSGLKIAIRDLEIRGAGDVLGLEQHGHMQKVGYNLYVQLLKNVVSEIKGNNEPKETDIRIETDIDAFISNDYINNSNYRIAIYLKIANIKTKEEFDKLYDMIAENYKDVPCELINLMKIALLKNICKIQGVEKIVLKNKENYVQFEKDYKLTPELIEKINFHKDTLVLNVENMPIIKLITQNIKDKLDYLINFFIS